MSTTTPGTDAATTGPRTRHQPVDGSVHEPAPETTREATHEAADLRRLGLVGGGVALLASAALMWVGNLTSPEQTAPDDAGYLASLARDTTLSAVSALAYHWSWTLLAFGLVASMLLVRRRRGRALVAWGAVLGAVGAVSMSGLLLSDWFGMAAVEVVGTDAAVEVFRAATGEPLVAVLWSLPAKVLGLLGPVLLLAGLARAGVLGWWTVPVAVLGVVAPALAFGLPFFALVSVLLQAPVVALGLRLVARGRTGRDARDLLPAS
ncbi:hypothetical protein [Cellulomonas marina]|uniref:DUF4386 family protein n=1 Tax=Cellulomonas marina TaxID=988821 RepID=A0A1I1AM03_9CELL|nr:hypothetical protein [Cellulomonas marina]GIG30451.1 hypothetical protein Cma02nite_30510 [Cellulomonas marina]SFB39059.1 hypothetical protein SAMN05421867_12015 [Cellulomonas marina]